VADNIHLLEIGCKTCLCYYYICVFCVIFLFFGESVSEDLTLLDVLSTLYYCSVFILLSLFLLTINSFIHSFIHFDTADTEMFYQLWVK